MNKFFINWHLSMVHPAMLWLYLFLKVTKRMDYWFLTLRPPPPLHQVRTMSPKILFLIDAFRNYTLRKYWKNFLLDTLIIQMVAKHIWIPNCLFERKEPQYNILAEKLSLKVVSTTFWLACIVSLKESTRKTHLFPFKSSSFLR